jgi:hypothetical protein
MGAVFRGLLNPRQCSLLRSNLLVLVSLAAAFPLSDFPHNRPTLLLLFPTLLAVVGTADTCANAGASTTAAFCSACTWT